MPKDAIASINTPDGLLVEGPIPRGIESIVRITDPLSGETVEKLFATAGKARRFMADALIGETSPTRAKPLPMFQDAQSSQIKVQSRPRYHKDGRLMTPEEQAASPRLNIGAVKDVLEDYGLDPTAELAKVINAEKPLLDREGNVQFVKGDDGLPITDPLTGEMQPVTEPVLSQSQRSMLLAELLQYVTPKLRAVEMKAEIRTPPSEQAMDQRIAALVAKHPELQAVVDAARGASK